MTWLVRVALLAPCSLTACTASGPPRAEEPPPEIIVHSYMEQLEPKDPTETMHLLRFEVLKDRQLRAYFELQPTRTLTLPIARVDPPSGGRPKLWHLAYSSLTVMMVDGSFTRPSLGCCDEGVVDMKFEPGETYLIEALVDHRDCCAEPTVLRFGAHDDLVSDPFLLDL